MAEIQDVQTRYEQALDSLVGKLKQDHTILAALLVGSLSYDVVWERSDIDMLLITQEGPQKAEDFCLVEAGIDIHASVVTRSQFRRILEGATQSSFIHSFMTKGRLLFTRDETLAELFAHRDRLGERDRATQLLRVGATVLPCFTKAEKWLAVKRDPDYCFLWIMKCIDALASIEALMQGEITGREVIHQALRLNPPFFRSIYTDLIRQEKTPEALQAALTAIRTYLLDRAPILYGPIFTYLYEANGIRSVTEIRHHFSNQMNLDWVVLACEWLADQDLIQKVSCPLRLTGRSRVDVEEAAYYYDGDLHEKERTR